MGRIAKVIKIAHCRPRYHLTGVLAPPQADGEPAHRFFVSSLEHTDPLMRKCFCAKGESVPSLGEW